MTDAQAEMLWDSAAALGEGAMIVEIGSFRGRSTIVLARAAGRRARVTAIDPHAGNDRGPQEIAADAARGSSDNEVFRRNLGAAGVAEAVRHVRLPSSEALSQVQGELDLLYVDGAHRYGPARDDVRDWGRRIRPGGRLLVHDAFSSIGVTLALLRLMPADRTFRYAGRAGSLALYVRQAEPLPPGAHARNVLRQLAQLPWFARNVAIKVLLVARLGRLTRLLGHHSGHWPY